nr:hypothetical protein [uncultured Methanoregula sp.]
MSGFFIVFLIPPLLVGGYALLLFTATNRISAVLIVIILVAGCTGFAGMQNPDAGRNNTGPGFTGAPATSLIQTPQFPDVVVTDLTSGISRSSPTFVTNRTMSRLTNFAPGEIADPQQIARIALTDPSARRMADAGGELAGVRMAIKRSARANSNDGGVFPALLIRYNGLEVDFMVDPVLQKTVGRTVQVPNGAMILEKGNRTEIEYNGSVLFTFEPMEAVS